MTRLGYIVFFLIFLQACATVEPKPVVDTVALYKEGVEEGKQAMIGEVKRNLRQKGAYGHTRPYHPVRLPADIRKVWIVDHPNEAGDLVQGHWVFMVVMPGRWASTSLPPVHPESGERTSHTVPVIEDKPIPSPTGAQGKMNASQNQ